MKWVWRTRNDNVSLYKDLVTTPVLESLVSAICCDIPTLYSYDYHDELRKNDIIFMWDLLKHIGHHQTGLINVRILNKLIHICQGWDEKEKVAEVALEVFHKFEVFQCVPNQDTYIFTLEALFKTTSCSTYMLQQAASICQKMLLHPETLLPDDHETLDYMLFWFSQNNMIKEAHDLYLAAICQKSLEFDVKLHSDMIARLCSKKETVHLALKMGVEDWDEEAKNFHFWDVVESLCEFKHLDAAKQLIFKMISDGPIRYPEKVFSAIIIAYVEAGEVGQALEMVVLMESNSLCTCCDSLMPSDLCSISMLKIVREILEEAKRKDYKLIIALLHHTLTVGYCILQKFDEALKLLTQMKDLGVSCTNHDELIHSLHLKAMDRKMSREQLEEMEPMDRAMAEAQLDKMDYMDMKMKKDILEQPLEEMHLNIRETFS